MINRIYLIIIKVDDVPAKYAVEVGGYEDSRVGVEAVIKELAQGTASTGAPRLLAIDPIWNIYKLRWICVPVIRDMQGSEV